jgi:hypothetical protein
MEGDAMPNLESANDFKQYASFASPINLLTDSELTGSPPCRQILINDAGSGTKQLVVKTPNGTTRTLTVATGETYPIHATEITAATTVALLTAFW